MANKDCDTTTHMDEFQLIASLTRSLPINKSVVVGPGDDCALLDYGLPDRLLLFKTDAIVEGIHFTSDAPPEKIGHKALARCLSDVAAMAGTPNAALITVGLPRNFDPRINAIDNVYLYDIDDLGAVAEENLGERTREAEKAEHIVTEEVESFWRWLGHLEVVPTIVALRTKMEAIRHAELQKTLSALKDLGPREREAVESMTAAIVNKILHTPITRLKQHDRRSEAFYIDAARRLFDIKDTDES